MKTITHSTRLPFEITCITSTGRVRLDCHHSLRIFPGRRIVCDAFMGDENVIVKIFAIDADGERLALNEITALQRLHAKGIDTASVLYSGHSEGRDFYIIVYKKIQQAHTLRELWEQTADTDIISRLVSLLAEQHNQGVLHNDPHLNNFLLANDTIYTLDAQDIAFQDTPVTELTGMQRLAECLTFFRLEDEAQIEIQLNTYMQVRRLSVTEQHLAQLIDMMRQSLSHKQQDYLKKIFRECSEFVCNKDFRQFAVYPRRLSSTGFDEFIQAPNSVFTATGAAMLKNGNTCTVIGTRIDDLDVVIKRYNIKNLLHVLRRCWRPTRAAHSWRNAHMLTTVYNIPTAAPLALIEKRFGPLRLTSWYVMQQVATMSAHELFLDATISIEEKRLYAGRLVEILIRMARFQISHGDMKATNFLFRDGQFFVIDLDSMRQHHRRGSFETAFRRDLQRFMQNWQGSAVLSQLFHELLSCEALTPCFAGAN